MRCLRSMTHNRSHRCVNYNSISAETVRGARTVEKDCRTNSCPTVFFLDSNIRYFFLNITELLFPFLYLPLLERFQLLVKP